MNESDKNTSIPDGSTENNQQQSAGQQPYTAQPYQGNPVNGSTSYPQQPYTAQPYQGNPVNGSTSYPQQPQTYVPGVYNNAQQPYQAQPPAVVSNTQNQKQRSKINLGKNGKIAVTIAIAVFAVAVVSVSSILIYRAFSDKTAPNKSKYSDFQMNTAETSQTDTTIKGDETELTPAQVAAKVRPSIVSVITNDTLSYDSTNSGEGSGIIIDSDGYIVTNSHVIGDSKKYNVSVITDEGKTYDAKVIGYDTRSDLAVLKIDAKNLPECELGDSSKLVLGDYVVAIGNPGGVQFAGSITNGIVSGVDRIIDTRDTESTSAMRYIQTNAAINPGNSGGALVNMYGQVIGVNTSKISASGYEGMGFAIPSNTVKDVLQDLVDYGYVQGRVKLGITCITISSAYESQGIPAGLQIYSIDSSSDMNGKAQVYDIITHCNGTKIASLSQLQDIIFKKSPGDTVQLTLYRAATADSKASSYDINVKLLEDTGETEEETAPSNDNSDNNNGGSSNDEYDKFFSDFFGNNKGKNY